MTGVRRTPIFGPEPWAQVAGQRWCHFDRWFALVAVREFGGDLDRLQVALEQRLRSLTGRRDVEAKLSHLADLRERLAGAGLGPAALAEHETVDKPTWTKARRKVLDQALENRSMTEPMRRTPRARLEQRARRGHWQ